jgi:hypothetical protein
MSILGFEKSKFLRLRTNGFLVSPSKKETLYKKYHKEYYLKNDL